MDNNATEVEPEDEQFTEEQKRFIKDSSDQIADKFRQMFREEIVTNSTYPEMKGFQQTLFFTYLIHDDTKRIEKHLELVENFIMMMREVMNMPAEHATPGLKAIEDLMEKYGCMELASNIEKRIEQYKLEEERKALNKKI